MLTFAFDREDNVSLGSLCVLSLIAATTFSNERTNPIAYSKFANKEVNAKAPSTMLLTSRLGMLIIYLPSAIVGIWMLQRDSVNEMGDSSMGLRPASVLLAIHFWKRVFEVLFVHVYSGSMAISSAVLISMSYTTYTWLIASRQVGLNSDNGNLQVLCGKMLFVVGTMGNLYHHLLLASLRTRGGIKDKTHVVSSGYQLPTGGLFDFVVAPHYLFELLAWAGIALTAQSLIALLVMSAMTSYLTARSLNTRDYYRHRFGKMWPEQRRALIPFIF